LRKIYHGIFSLIARKNEETMLNIHTLTEPLETTVQTCVTKQLAQLRAGSAPNGVGKSCAVPSTNGFSVREETDLLAKRQLSRIDDGPALLLEEPDDLRFVSVGSNLTSAVNKDSGIPNRRRLAELEKAGA
jgi:hypothetical protein